jgi:hypothetical protein
MGFKTWWYDSKTTKWQIIIGTLLVGVVFVGSFSFLETYQFEEWKYSAFSKSMIGILMGTVALGVITGVIIIFQSIVAMDKEKNQKIFDERLSLYKDFTKQTMSIISDNVLDNEERAQLKVIEKEVLMIASNETYKKWVELYNVMLQLKSDENQEVEDEEEIVLSISDKSVDFVNSCRMDLEIGVIDKATIQYSKEHSRTEIKNSKKFTVGNFNDYDSWLKQRLENDSRIKKADELTHKEINNYIVSEYPALDVKFRKHGPAFYHNNGKKVGNLYLDGKNGVTLAMLRSEDDGYLFPEIAYECKNASNTQKNSEYFFIINVASIDDSIKNVIKESYSIRDKNKKLLKSNHPKINEILGFN